MVSIFLSNSRIRLFCLFIILASTISVLSGCGNDLAPISPEISITADSSHQNSNRYLWGYYDFIVNDDHTDIQIVPNRSVQFSANVLNFIQPVDPNGVDIQGIFVNPDSTINATIILTHPFPTEKRYTGFDVWGIVMLPSAYHFPEHDLKLPGVFPGQSALLNADGYTRRFNPTEFINIDKPFDYFDGKLIKSGVGALCDSQVNPYRVFYSSENRRYFEAGAGIGRVYHMSFKPGPQIFGYAVSASWGEPTLDINILTKQPNKIPDSFLLSANCTEPFDIQITGITGQLQCALDTWAGGEVNLTVKVSDWQKNAWVGHSNFTVEAPELFDGVRHSYGGTEEGNSFNYFVSIPNQKVTSPKKVPIFISVKVPDNELYYLPGVPLAAYQMKTLEVEEIKPPFCNGKTAIPTTYGGAYQLNNSQAAQHLDASFLPTISGGEGALIYDGGIVGSTQRIQIATPPPTGGSVPGTTLIQRTGINAGVATVLQTNDFNGHVILVSDADRDNVLIYNTAGVLLKEYDLGNGSDGYNEPVSLATNPVTGDIWLIGHKGTMGIDLEKWTYVAGETTFEYVFDPNASVSLLPYLGSDPKPLGLTINGYYNQALVFHGANNGSIEVFGIAGNTTIHNDIFSSSNIFTEPVVPVSVSGVRKLLGGDIIIDHVDGDEIGACRVIVLANFASGSKLYRMDIWGQILNSVNLGGTYGCITMNNLPAVSNRALIAFPTFAGTAYYLWLPPSGEW